MRRSLAFLATAAILAVGCSGGGASGAPSSAAPTDAVTPSEPAASAQGDSSAPSVAASAVASAAPSSAAGVLPADCAKGLGEYLVAIEPLVSAFDPASGTLASLQEADVAASSKAYEMLDANDGYATYSCSEVGLQWAYFDTRSPWDAVMAVAADVAPGTVGYLTGVRRLAAVDVDPLSTYGIDGCEAAEAAIKQRIAAHIQDGVGGVDELPFDEGIDLVGVYRAYLAEVRNEACPRDQLGNDEYLFISSAG